MSTRLATVAAFVVAAVLSFLASCGPTSRCGPGACDGCCDAMGACVTASSITACGTGGASCSTCTRSDSCVNGACVPFDAGTTGMDAGACAGCRGCCQNGVCRTGNLTNACGTDGGVCDDCTVGNRLCTAGACRVTCGPSNCQGCCRNNECITETTKQACGRGGAACTFCPTGQGCVASQCVEVDGGMSADGGEGCSATCDGCCDASDACLPGLENVACGNLGGRCVVCTGMQCRRSTLGGGGRCL